VSDAWEAIARVNTMAEPHREQIHTAIGLFGLRRCPVWTCYVSVCWN